MNEVHKPVLLKEAVEGLNVHKGGVYIDCNLGGGGHTSEIIRKGGVVLGFDVDKEILMVTRKALRKEISGKRLFIVNSNFKNICEVLKSYEWDKGDGILYDLGLSTFQLKKENKGFSFEDDAVIDMRMDMNLGVSANDLIKVLSDRDLGRIIFEYGEEPKAYAYAKVLKSEQQKYGGKLTAKQASQAVLVSSKQHKYKIHPATRVFQALRITVNSELENFTESVNAAIPLLKPKGRMAIITFHSLEDKIAKNLAGSPHLIALNKKPIVPSEDEILQNPSSRSAKLRIYEKI